MVKSVERQHAVEIIDEARAWTEVHPARYADDERMILQVKIDYMRVFRNHRNAEGFEQRIPVTLLSMQLQKCR